MSRLVWSQTWSARAMKRKKMSRRCVQKIWEVDRNSFQLHGDRHHLVFYEPLVRCLYLMCDWWHWWVWVLPVPVLKVIRSYDRVSRRVRNSRLQTGGKESANRQSPQSSENTEVEILNKVHPGTWSAEWLMPVADEKHHATMIVFCPPSRAKWLHSLSAGKAKQ